MLSNKTNNKQNKQNKNNLNRPLFTSRYKQIMASQSTTPMRRSARLRAAADMDKAVRIWGGAGAEWMDPKMAVGSISQIERPTGSRVQDCVGAQDTPRAKLVDCLSDRRALTQAKLMATMAQFAPPLGR